MLYSYLLAKEMDRLAHDASDTIRVSRPPLGLTIPRRFRIIATCLSVVMPSALID
jgi:hypothetical protein